MKKLILLAVLIATMSFAVAPTSMAQEAVESVGPEPLYSPYYYEPYYPPYYDPYYPPHPYYGPYYPIEPYYGPYGY